jgi:hypothetical protein
MSLSFVFRENPGQSIRMGYAPAAASHPENALARK